MKIGAHIEIVDRSTFIFDGEVIEGVRSFKISHSRTKSTWSAEVFVKKDSLLEWEFAKELHVQGFNVMAHYQTDWFEWYYDKKGQSQFSAMPLRKQAGQQADLCTQCAKPVQKDTPWCHRPHEIK
jgi:hypothetical protein